MPCKGYNILKHKVKTRSDKTVYHQEDIIIYKLKMEKKNFAIFITYKKSAIKYLEWV